MATLGIKINYVTFSDVNYNEAYICGYDGGGTLADVDGSILVNGVATTVPKGPLYTNRSPNIDAYIVFDTSATGFNFGGLGTNRPYAMARRAAVGWEYDDNGSSWVGFTPTATHFVIGAIRVEGLEVGAPGSPPGIGSAVMYDTAVRLQTDAEFDAWLKSPKAMRTTLVEADVKLALDGSVITRHLSSRPYITGQLDSPASTNYIARITGGIKFSRSLSLEGTTSLSFGDIELINTNGALDSWLDDYWVNRQIRVLVGDASWPRQDFRVMYVGQLTGVDSRKRDRINLKLSDALQKLNTPVTELKVGGSGARADDLRPLLFGECHNISPVLIDSTVNEYMVHNGSIESIIEVRDNGVPVSFTPDLANGKFRLNQQPAGTITASAQGAKPTTLSSGSTYTNKIGDIIYSLMIDWGNAATRPVALDIDTASVVQFNTDHPQPVGIYLEDRQNVLDVCNQLAASVGARLYVNRAGKISLVQLSLPWAGATTATVTAADMVDHTLEPKQMVDVAAGTKIGYCKNWTVQDGLTTGLIQEHVALFGEEWLSMTATDSTAAANYNLYTDPSLIETNLLVASDALAEANRRLAIFSTQRKVFKFTGLPTLSNVNLGDYVQVTHPRFGLSGGKVGQILSVAIDPMSPQIEFEVLV